MMRFRRATGLLALIVMALVSTACAGGEESTDAAAGEGYGTVNGRVGYLRLPPPSVDEAEFLDYTESPDGVAYWTIADNDELLLVYFGYLSCPDVCPTTLADVSQAIDLLPPDLAERVSVAMATVDLERDEGPQVATYLDVFVDRHHGLRSEDETSLKAAADLYGALWEIEEHEPGAAEYAVGHSATLYVVDDEGQVIWEFSFGSEAEAMATALESLFDERYA